MFSIFRDSPEYELRKNTPFVPPKVRLDTRISRYEWLLNMTALTGQVIRTPCMHPKTFVREICQQGFTIPLSRYILRCSRLQTGDLHRSVCYIVLRLSRASLVAQCNDELCVPWRRQMVLMGCVLVMSRYHISRMVVSRLEHVIFTVMGASTDAPRMCYRP